MLSALLPGCLPTQNAVNPDEYENTTQIEEIRFQAAEKKYYCGPEALSPVLTYYGQEATPKTVGKAIMADGEQGVNIVELKAYAEKKGVRTEIQRGSVELLEKSIDDQRPIIVLVEISKKQDVRLFFHTVPVFRINALFHFYTVVGYSERHFFLLGPNGRAAINKEDLVEIWKPMKYATLELWPSRT